MISAANIDRNTNPNNNAKSDLTPPKNLFAMNQSFDKCTKRTVSYVGLMYASVPAIRIAAGVMIDFQLSMKNFTRIF